MIPRLVMVVLAVSSLFGFLGAGVGFLFGNLAPAAVRTAFPTIGINLDRPTSEGIAAETIRTAVGAGIVNGVLVGILVGALALVLETWNRTKGGPER